MIDTIIIEDEPAVRREIKYLVSQEDDINILGTATNVKDAVALIKATKPKLVLMDIQLVDGTAFDVLSEFSEITFRIIFITAYNHFAIKAIKYGALDYLLKPLDEQELQAALQRARTETLNGSQQQQQLTIANDTKEIQDSLESHIVLHTMEYLQVVKLRDIIYCQSEGSYTNFFLTEGRKILISKPLKFYDEILPDQWFLRAHQSYLVNITCVDKFLKTGFIILKDKTEIPVSSRKKDYILQRINNI